MYYMLYAANRILYESVCVQWSGLNAGCRGWIGIAGHVSDDKDQYYQKVSLRMPFILDVERVMAARRRGMRTYDFPYEESGVDRRRNLSLDEFRDVYDGKWSVTKLQCLHVYRVYLVRYRLINYANSAFHPSGVDKWVTACLIGCVLVALSGERLRGKSPPDPWQHLDAVCFWQSIPFGLNLVVSCVTVCVSCHCCPAWQTVMFYNIVCKVERFILTN